MVSEDSRSSLERILWLWYSFQWLLSNAVLLTTVSTVCAMYEGPDDCTLLISFFCSETESAELSPLKGKVYTSVGLELEHMT